MSACEVIKLHETVVLFSLWRLSLDRDCTECSEIDSKLNEVLQAVKNA